MPNNYAQSIVGGLTHIIGAFGEEPLHNRMAALLKLELDGLNLDTLSWHEGRSHLQVESRIKPKSLSACRKW